METPKMGKVVTPALIENLSDLNLAKRGVIPQDQIRRIEVRDALVDTGALGLSLPSRLIKQLGLEYSCTRNIRTAAGVKSADMYGTVRLTIMERDLPTDVTEVPDDCPVLIGQVPLEVLDFVVDPKAQRLIGNPAHGGEQIIEIY